MLTRVSCKNGDSDVVHAPWVCPNRRWRLRFVAGGTVGSDPNAIPRRSKLQFLCVRIVKNTRPCGFKNYLPSHNLMHTYATQSTFTRCTCMKCGDQTTDGAPKQFVLKRFDAVPFLCFINKCRTRTNDKLEKCVRTVVSCVQCVEIYTEQRAFADGFNFLFSFEENCCRITLREAYGEHGPSQDKCELWFRVFKSDDFDTR